MPCPSPGQCCFTVFRGRAGGAGRAVRSVGGGVGRAGHRLPRHSTALPPPATRPWRRIRAARCSRPLPCWHLARRVPDVPGVPGRGVLDAGVVVFNGGAVGDRGRAERGGLERGSVLAGDHDCGEQSIFACGRAPAPRRSRRSRDRAVRASARVSPAGADGRAAAGHGDAGPVVPEAVTGAGVDGAQQPHVAG